MVALNEIAYNDELGWYMVIDSPTHGIFHVLIDVEDIEAIQQRRWHVSKTASRRAGAQFVVGSAAKSDEPYVLLHRYLLNPPDDKQIDHIDGQPLNNRRSNLRIVTLQQNTWNRVAAKGCYWHKGAKKWQAYITVNGLRSYLSYHDTEEEAHAAYLEAKGKFHVIECRQENV